MEHLIFWESDHGRQEVMRYSDGDMIEVFGADKAAKLQAGRTIYWNAGLATSMRHAAAEKVHADLESGDFEG